MSLWAGARVHEVSFRTIKRNRDYLQHRQNASWQYLARLAAKKEYAYLEQLHKNGFPVPVPVDWNRSGAPEASDRIEGLRILNRRLQAQQRGRSLFLSGMLC